MYCPYCQTVLQDDAIFCSSCGKKVTSDTATANSAAVHPQMQQYQEQKEAVRNSELTSLQHLIQHFSKKQSAYDLYDETCKQLPRYARGTKSVPLVFGCILTSFGLFCIAFMSFALFWSGSEYHIAEPFSWKELPSIIPPDYAMTLFAGACFTLIGSILILIWIMNKIKNTKRLNFYREQYSSLSQELNNHYLDYPNCPIGAEYTNPRILTRLERLILSGRADTMKESINRLLADANQRAIEKYLEEIQRNTAAINRNLRFGSVFIASRFFK